MAEPAHKLKPEEKAEPVIDALEECYGEKKRGDSRDPLSVLVRGVLSQNTSDVNSGRAYDSMMEEFGDWEGVAAASQEEIAEAIKSGGLAEQKARTIRSIMEWLSRRDGYSLDWLDELDDRRAERELTSIKGIGVKTARLVLLFGLERPVFVVDTHVYRVGQRLGLVPEGCGRTKAHDLLDELVPPVQKYPAHLNMIQHGRRTCRARNPLCDGCCVRQYCLYVRDLVDA